MTRKKKFNEETRTLGIRVPISKIDEFNEIFLKIRDGGEVPASSIILSESTRKMILRVLDIIDERFSLDIGEEFSNEDELLFKKLRSIAEGKEPPKTW